MAYNVMMKTNLEIPREPTEAMLSALPDHGDKYLTRGRAIDYWTIMYDVAVAELRLRPEVVD